ncbi:hypothetical protein V6N12_074812 [Hibiscus sabdariffa]|uniref:Uncharacterized protein n=1 Tax=Hibiscus sabdariffa TaxID=183260 RepID=A0ABR2D2H1_9ROSI
MTRVIRTLKAATADECKACHGSSDETQPWRLGSELQWSRKKQQQWTLTNGPQGRTTAAERRRGGAKDSNGGPNG